MVNNAGILKPVLLKDLDEATWDAHFDVNAKGVLLMCQAVLPHKRGKKTGRIGAAKKPSAIGRKSRR